MSIIPQLILNGIIAGAIYAIVAVGFSLIYSVTKFMHFAHGAMLAIAAYFVFLFVKIAGMNFWLSVILSIIITSLIGIGVNKFIYKPLRKRNASNAVLLIASFALLFFFNPLLLLIFGADAKTIPLSLKNIILEGIGARITLVQAGIIILALLMMIFMWLLMKKTKLGKAMRALADNKDVAQTIGINPEKIYNKTFFIGTFLAAIAGILIGLEQNIFPEMGIPLIVKGFTGAVIGGVGSVHGAVFGSLFLGLAENIGIWWLPSGYKDAIAFIILFIFLIFRPQGIFGVRKERC